MFVFVIPRLMGIYTSAGQKLPMPTRVLISTSQFITDWWVWLVVAIFGLVLLVSQNLKSNAGKRILSVFMLRLPVFGAFVLKSELSRFCQTLGLLIKNGLPILNAIEVAIPVLGNEIIRDKMRESLKSLEEGGSFGKSLKGHKVIPAFVSNLIVVGEESGKLDESLMEVAMIYEQETEESLKVFTSLLEPMMILVMGLIVGFIVVAMLFSPAKLICQLPINSRKNAPPI